MMNTVIVSKTLAKEGHSLTWHNALKINHEKHEIGCENLKSYKRWNHIEISMKVDKVVLWKSLTKMAGYRLKKYEC